MLEGLAPAAPHRVIRVLALRQEEEARLAPILHARKCSLQSPQRGAPAGGIPVKTEYYLRAESVDPLQVDLAGGRAQCSRGIRDAMLGEGDDIHVALHYQNTIQLAVVLASLVKSV